MPSLLIEFVWTRLFISSKTAHCELEMDGAGSPDETEGEPPVEGDDRFPNNMSCKLQTTFLKASCISSTSPDFSIDPSHLVAIWMVKLVVVVQHESGACEHS